MNMKSENTPVQRAAFPNHLENYRRLLPELLSILEQGQEQNWYAFVWLEENKTLSSISARTENLSESLDRGVVFRIMANGVHYEKSTNILEEEHLTNLAKQFRKKVEAKVENIENLSPAYQPLSWKEEIALPLSDEFLVQIPQAPSVEEWVHFGVRCEMNPEETTLEGLKSLSLDARSQVLQASKEYVEKENQQRSEKEKHQELAEVQTLARQRMTTHMFVDRNKRISQTLPVSLLYSMGISTTGVSGRSAVGGVGGLELAKLSEEDVQEAALTPIKLSLAEKLQPGRYQVITGPDVTGVIAHEAFGHTQEGDTWMKGRSIAKNLKNDGVKVGNEQASIVNYGAVLSMGDLNHGTNGSYFFDNEGQLSRPQNILDQGMLSTPMTDLTSSMAMDVPRTANGKRESWRRPLMTRQTNTYFTPGDKTVKELIGMVSYGFMAGHAHGGMEDPKGGSLTAGTSYLEEIKDGKLTGKLFLGPNGGHIELTDPVFTLLDRIVAKSKSQHPEGIPENKYGGCGKYHKEGVDAGCGGPYILWESINCG